MKLLCDHDRTQDGQLTLEIPWLEYIRTQGYTLREIQELHSVHSNSRDGAHIVAKIETYRFPKNNPTLDVGNPEHQVALWVCSCEDFTYNRSVDVSEPDVTPGMADTCKHIQECSKVERAKSDKHQEQLIE